MQGRPDVTANDPATADRAQREAVRRKALLALQQQRAGLLAQGVSGVPEITPEMGMADIASAAQRLNTISAAKAAGSPSPATAPVGRFTTAGGMTITAPGARPAAVAPAAAQGPAPEGQATLAELQSMHAQARANLVRVGATNLPAEPGKGASMNEILDYSDRLLSASEARFGRAPAAAGASSTSPNGGATTAARPPINDAFGRLAAPAAEAYPALVQDAQAQNARNAAPAAPAAAPGVRFQGFDAPPAPAGAPARPADPYPVTGPRYASERGPNYIKGSEINDALAALPANQLLSRQRAGGPGYGLVSATPVSTTPSLPPAPTRPTLGNDVAGEIVKANPQIGVAGSGANKAFVAGYRGIDDAVAARTVAASVNKQFPAPTPAGAGDARLAERELPQSNATPMTGLGELKARDEAEMATPAFRGAQAGRDIQAIDQRNIAAVKSVGTSVGNAVAGAQDYLRGRFLGAGAGDTTTAPTPGTEAVDRYAATNPTMVPKPATAGFQPSSGNMAGGYDVDALMRNAPPKASGTGAMFTGFPDPTSATPAPAPAGPTAVKATISAPARVAFQGFDAVDGTLGETRPLSMSDGGGALSTGKLQTGGLSTGSLETGKLETGGLSTGKLETGGLETGKLSSGGLTTGSLTTGSLSTGGLSTGTLKTGGLDTGGLTTGGLTTGGLTSGGLTSGGLGKAAPTTPPIDDAFGRLASPSAASPTAPAPAAAANDAAAAEELRRRQAAAAQGGR